MATLASQARQVGDCVWEIPPAAKPGMLVPARVYASGALLAHVPFGQAAQFGVNQGD